MTNEFYEPTLELPVRGSSIGSFSADTTEKQTRDWLKRHRQGRICPVCLDTISDHANTCSRCVRQWRTILRTPRLLAEWIVDVAQHYRAGVRHLTLWKETE